MSDIDKMNFNQLRNEVQLLRDELAIFKRKYEDIIYNLDNDNFSSQLIKEKEGMKTSIEQTEESITLHAEKIEGNSTKIGTLEVTAEAIESEVFEEKADGTKTSKIKQTADAIASEVTARKNADNQLSTQITQTSESISTRVGKVEKGKYGEYTLFTQSFDTFLFDGRYMKISSAIQLTDNSGNHTFSIFHNEGNGVSAGDRGTYITGISPYLNEPLIIGGTGQKVYLGDKDTKDNNLIATQGWVLENGGVAKFA
jgi:hypothetical protein